MIETHFIYAIYIYTIPYNTHTHIYIYTHTYLLYPIPPFSDALAAPVHPELLLLVFGNLADARVAPFARGAINHPYFDGLQQLFLVKLGSIIASPTSCQESKDFWNPIWFCQIWWFCSGARVEKFKIDWGLLVWGDTNMVNRAATNSRT